jgi:hypothetical protein
MLLTQLEQKQEMKLVFLANLITSVKVGTAIKYHVSLGIFAYKGLKEQHNLLALLVPMDKVASPAPLAFIALKVVLTQFRAFLEIYAHFLK